MTITGFDPYTVAGTKSNFFEKWVESLLGGPFGTQSKSSACKKAADRAVRVQTFLQEVAKQTTLFDLGIQSYAAGHYSSARTFFTAFGREFTRREVHNNIGLTYVGEAMEIRERLLSLGENLGPGFMFRYVLDEDAGIPKERTQRGGTRGGSLKPDIVKLHGEMERLFNEAIPSLRKGNKT